MTAVYVTPAAMAEQGAALRALLDGIRRGLQRMAVAVIDAPAARGRLPRHDHAEMARLRQIAHEVQAMRHSAYTGIALGGPSPR
jgi:hypothetical protein